jgi:hypothetical protein
MEMPCWGVSVFLSYRIPDLLFALEQTEEGEQHGEFTLRWSNSDWLHPLSSVELRHLTCK